MEHDDDTVRMDHTHLYLSINREFQTRVFLFRNLGNTEKCSGNLFPAPSLSNERISDNPHSDPRVGFRARIVDSVSNTKANLATPVT